MDIEALKTEHLSQIERLKTAVDHLQTHLLSEKAREARANTTGVHLPTHEQLMVIHKQLDTLKHDTHELLLWMRQVVPSTANRVNPLVESKVVHEYVNNLRCDPTTGYASSYYNSKLGTSSHSSKPPHPKLHSRSEYSDDDDTPSVFTDSE